MNRNRWIYDGSSCNIDNKYKNIGKSGSIVMHLLRPEAFIKDSEKGHTLHVDN